MAAVNSSKSDAEIRANRRSSRSITEALCIVDPSEERTTADDDQPCLKSKLAVVTELTDTTAGTAGGDADSDAGKKPEATPHREYLRKLFAELRQEGARDSEDGESIFEVKGERPTTKIFKRFGSSADRLMYTLCRLIATLDIICVLPYLSNGNIMRVGVLRHFAMVRAFEIVTGSVYLYGVMLRFFTSIVDVAHATEYVELHEIFNRHVYSWKLWADVLSLVGNLWWLWPDWWFVAGFRLLRAWRLPSSTNQTYLITSGRTESPLRNSVELVVALWIVAHVFGCIWFCVDTLQLEDEAHQLEAHQVTRHIFKKEDEVAEEVLETFIQNTGEAYLEYMTDGAAMLVGWNGPEPRAAINWTRKEMIFWIVVAPCAAMYINALVAWLLKIVERLGMNENKHSETINNLSSILTSLKAPEALQRRVLQYHAFLSVHNIDQAAYEVLFTGLSSNLYVETKLFLFESLVLTAPFFEDVPPQYIMQLISSLVEAVFSPGDMIVQKGQVGDELFFIIKGSCEVLIDDNATVVVAVKHMGEYFGEIALVLDQVRSAWIRAKTFSVLAQLVREAFEKILESVPDVKTKMISRIMKECKQIAPAPPEIGSKADLEMKQAKAKAEPQAEPQLEARRSKEKPRLSLTGYIGDLDLVEQNPGLDKVETQIFELQLGQASIEESVKQIGNALELIHSNLSWRSRD